MSFKKYKAIDLIVWLVIYSLFEFLIVKAETSWLPNEPWCVSLMLPLLLIVMMRWGAYSAIHAILFAVIFVFYYGAPGTWQQYVAYLLGNAGFMLTLIFRNKFGKDKVASKWYYTAIYVLIGFVSMELFRSIGSLILGSQPTIFLSNLTRDALDFVFALLVCLIARKADGLFADQKSYLIAQEKRKKRIQKADADLESYPGSEINIQEEKTTKEE